ncbi:hypothetical protein EJB05_13543, partial [Eragrostis curvula]
MADAAAAPRGIEEILVSGNRDFLVRNSGEQVKVSNVDASIIALYFSATWCLPSRQFTLKLVEAYNELASQGKSFEVVFVSNDLNEEEFNSYFAKMSWLAVPFSDPEGRQSIADRFEVTGIPHLVILNAKTGQVCTEDGIDCFIEYGIEAYPFTPERINELKGQEIPVEEAKAKAASEALQSLLVYGDLDFVIGKEGAKVPVSKLVGKTVLLYFSAKSCGPCQVFLPRLVKEYRKIQEKNTDFDIVFISYDKDQRSYDEHFSEMTWLALPMEDERKEFLIRTFKIQGIPSLVAIGPTGQTVTKDARTLLMIHGADAFPFTKERLAELKKSMDKIAKEWPKMYKHKFHDHEFILENKDEEVKTTDEVLAGYVCEGGTSEQISVTVLYLCEQRLDYMSNGWSEQDVPTRCGRRDRQARCQVRSGLAPRHSSRRSTMHCTYSSFTHSLASYTSRTPYWAIAGEFASCPTVGSAHPITNPLP